MRSQSNFSPATVGEINNNTAGSHRWWSLSVASLATLLVTADAGQLSIALPVIITEFGADALGGLHADSDTRWSEEYQDQLYKNQFKMLDAIPGLRGMTPWVLVDFRSPRRPHPYFQDFWNRKGLLSETGKKKQAFYTLKAYYDQKQQQYK